MDERFLFHRWKSTSLAGVVGGLALVAWFVYNQVIHHELRYDLLVIASLMAVTKLVALLYYRLHN